MLLLRSVHHAAVLFFRQRPLGACDCRVLPSKPHELRQRYVTCRVQAVLAVLRSFILSVVVGKHLALRRHRHCCPGFGNAPHQRGCHQ